MIRGLIYGLCLAVLWAGGASACAGDSGEPGDVEVGSYEAGPYWIYWPKEANEANPTYDYAYTYEILCENLPHAETVLSVRIDGHEVYRLTREELALACKVLKMEREGGASD